ncbi:AraC family transcriptional activator of pobA [Pseudorhizobium tarimense]|uniref:AraC family transcriptional activator of pobA n=1 Tax=Pseudorhizobium tarimense TaxID=1079109 RepID=A0ABV2H4U6_9HYPH|nr:helix-turn-helix domain-containing protein [Pseudorhizobium tarimense]MCJ8518662.1 helix-turn-helix domain-containing protein [Pseudorhizobium tarimense]
MTTSVPTFGLYGEQTREKLDFWVHCETIASRSRTYQWEIGLHKHDNFFQILYIHNGTGDALLGQSTSPLSPPCVVLMPPGISHGYRFSKDVEGFVITVVADQLRLTAELLKRPDAWLRRPHMLPLSGVSDQGYVDTTIRRLAEEIESGRSDRNDLIDSYLTTLLTLAGRLAGPQNIGVSGDTSSARVSTLKAMIGRSYRSQMPAAEYARRLNLSPTHLNRIVRQVTGMTVHDLIMSRVIDEARRALVFTPATVQQVADDLGFADAGYFSRCFRKRTGQTPGAFRRSERRKLSGDVSADENGTEIVDVRARRSRDEEVAESMEA